MKERRSIYSKKKSYLNKIGTSKVDNLHNALTLFKGKIVFLNSPFQILPSSSFHGYLQLKFSLLSFLLLLPQFVSTL